MFDIQVVSAGQEFSSSVILNGGKAAGEQLYTNNCAPI